MTVACRDVEAATLAHDGSPPITQTTFPTCRAHYPGGSSGCSYRLLPRSCSLPQMAGGSASALSLSRPARASHALRPAGSLSRPRRPLSRGSSPSGYPAEPLVSFQINRQLSGWNPPPLVISRLRGARPARDIDADDLCRHLAKGRMSRACANRVSPVIARAFMLLAPLAAAHSGYRNKGRSGAAIRSWSAAGSLRYGTRTRCVPVSF
jgi:hypothetical protein